MVSDKCIIVINIWPLLAHLRYMGLQNVSDLDFDLSRSRKVKWDGDVGVSMNVRIPIEVS